MKDIILQFLDEQIEDCNIFLKQASGNSRETCIGAVNAFEETREYIELLEEDKE